MASATAQKRTRSTLLQESTLLEGGVVDADAGVIRGVKILGRESKNGREYSDGAIRQAAGMYEGIEVNIDHPDKSKPGADRKLSEAFGVLENVTVKADGAYGDLKYLKTHPLASTVAEAAERMPGKLGLSHNADGKVAKRGGKNVVESIERVRSVDLVRNPASTNGLFESRDTVSTTIREVFESLPADCKAKAGLLRFLEDDPSMGATPMEAPPADAGSGAQIKAGFKAEVLTVLDDESLDAKSMGKRISEILKALEKAMDAINGKSKEQSADSGDGGDGPPTMESLQAEVQALRIRDEVRGLLESAGIKASEVQIEAAVALPTADKRKAFVASLPKAAPVNPRPAFSRPLFESSGNTAPKVPDPKDFAQAIR